MKEQGENRVTAIRPSGTAISLGQDRNMYQTSYHHDTHGVATHNPKPNVFENRNKIRGNISLGSDAYNFTSTSCGT